MYIQCHWMAKRRESTARASQLSLRPANKKLFIHMVEEFAVRMPPGLGSTHKPMSGGRGHLGRKSRKLDCKPASALVHPVVDYVSAADCQHAVGAE